MGATGRNSNIYLPSDSGKSKGQFMTDDSSGEQPASAPKVDSRKQLSRLINSLEKSRFSFTYAASLAPDLAELASEKMLLQYMRDTKAMVRFAAVEAFKFRDEELSDAAIDQLLTRIDDRHDAIAAAAILVLGEKKVESTVDELLDCVTMDNARVACASLEALYELSPDEAKEHFDEFLDHGDFPRVASAARVIQKHNLAEHLPRLLTAAEQLTEELNPSLDQNNPWTIDRKFMMEIVDVMASFKYEPAVELLRKLGSGYVGLRTHSLQALQVMGVDVTSMIEEAMERKPSRGLRFLQTGEFEDEEVGGKQIGVRLLHPHMAANMEKLSAADSVTTGRMAGKAIAVEKHYAIIELSNGLHAVLPCEEMHWTCLRNLKPYSERLEHERNYEIVHTDAESGYVVVSHKAVHENPWSADSGFFASVSQGEVEAFVRGGALIRLSDVCIGFLPTESAGFGSPRNNDFDIGDQVHVRVEAKDPEGGRVTLARA
jgi:hypothetical protein